MVPRGRQSSGRAGQRAHKRLDTEQAAVTIWKSDSLDQNSWKD